MVSQKSKINEVKYQEHTFDDKIPYKLFDALNIKIVKELVNNPDISSTEIAAKYNTPLSTIQRRRSKIEESVLKKTYTLDISRLGWRIADLLVSVEKGKGEETAQKLLQTNGSNVIIASLRIGHPQVNVMAQVFYKNSEELHNLMEDIRSMTSVTSVEWAEVVRIVGSNNIGMIDAVFDGSAKQNPIMTKKIVFCPTRLSKIDADMHQDYTNNNENRASINSRIMT